VVQRFRIVGIGLALGAVFALWVAGPVMPSGLRFADRVLVWASVVGGPVVGTVWGMAKFHTGIQLGWLGLLLVPAHPIRPNVATGCGAVFGLVLWYYSGFLAMMVATWGA